jgi:hypothetical protein
MSSRLEVPATGAPGPRAWWHGLPSRRRRQLRWLFALAGVFVLLVSVELARFLQVDNVERDDALALIQAEARGDAAGMIAQLSGCRESPACVASVKREAANPQVRRGGAVKLLSLDSQTANSPTAKSGTTRLAWTVIGSLPIVQCVKVTRTGNVLAGMHVRLTGLTDPIANEGLCRKRTTNEIEEEEATAAEQ